MMRFVLPDAEHRNDVLAFYREFENAGETCIGFRYHDDYDMWLRDMRNRKTATDLPEGFVRENFYICYEDDALAGVFSLKFELTDYLLSYGGHIGYAVAPSKRRRGIATEMLRQGIGIAAEFGFDRLLLVCDDDNCASEKVIIKNGGVYENKLYDDEENVYVKRYWITL